MEFVFEKESMYVDKNAESALHYLDQLFMKWNVNNFIHSVTVKPMLEKKQLIYAYISPSVISDNLRVNLILYDTAIDMLINNPNDTEINHVLKHECGHCIDAHNIYLQTKLFTQKGFDYNASKSSVLQNLGLYYWGEYFAHRFSYDGVFFRSQFKSIIGSAQECCLQLQVLKKRILIDTIRIDRINTYRVVLANISRFIYDVINLLADSHSSNERLFGEKIELLASYNKLGLRPFENWIVDVGDVLSRTYLDYPSSLKVETIEHIGKTIFTLFDYFDIHIFEDKNNMFDFEINQSI